MAKVFGGFTPEQMGKIIPEMAGMQTDEQAKFLAATPSAASRVGMMAEQASKRISMAQGGYVQGYQIGGLANQANTGSSRPDMSQPPSAMNVELDKAQQNIATANTSFQKALDASTADPSNKAKSDAVNKAQVAVNNANAAYGTAQKSFKVTELPSADEFSSKLYKDPASVVSESKVATASEADKAAGMLADKTGAIKGDAPQATVTTATTAPPVATPEKAAAGTYETLPATASVEEVLKRLEAATGKPSADAVADAQTMNPEELARLGLDVAQIEQATTVVAPEARTLQEGELISGSAVDMDRVRVETNFEAATGAPSTDATVQGQLTGLMQDFEGKNPPAWAAGAMRNAAALMASRGLSASSMAGQAAIQAAMESAIPIAQVDASTFAKFESQNLSNKQQAAMFAAEKRSEFLGLEFNQEFQSRVANASRVADIANINFSAEQQIALENARMAQTVDLTNLSSQNAKILADAAAMSQMDMANLNNRQQAQITNAQSFLQMDMASLSNTQQTAMYKAQQTANSLLSDTAAENASKQFNATSENQANQFFANLAANIALQNSEQANAMAQFNAGETNSLEQYNATQRTAREQFNATNALVVAQANATWSQSITTSEIAAQNQSNRDAAMTANEFTMASYNAILQEERDLVSYAFKTAENQAERELRVQLAALEAELSRSRTQAELDSAKGSGFGKIIASIAPTIIEYGLGKLG